MWLSHLRFANGRRRNHWHKRKKPRKLKIKVKLHEHVNAAQLQSQRINKSCVLSTTATMAGNPYFIPWLFFLTRRLFGIIFNGAITVSMTNKTKPKFWKRLKSQTTSTYLSWHPKESLSGHKETEKDLKHQVRAALLFA